MSVNERISELVALYRTFSFDEIEILALAADADYRNAPANEKADAYADMMAIKAVSDELHLTGTIAA